MRKYNKDNHLRIIDNKIYFYNIDFSLSSNEDILDVLLTDVADISFKECRFDNIDASNKIIKAPISFINCVFGGDMSCNDTEFCKAIYFDDCFFEKKVSFINAIFNKSIEFRNSIFYSVADFTDNNLSFCQAFNIVALVFQNEAFFNGRNFNNGKIMECRFDAPF